MRFQMTHKKPHQLAQGALAVLLALMVALSSSMLAPLSAQAEEGEEGPSTAERLDALRQRADSIKASIDALQTDLNRVTEEYDAALDARHVAAKAMREAKVKIDASQEKMEKLQEQIEALAQTMYKSDKSGASSNYMNVLLGASTFTDFMTGLDMMERVNESHAELVEECRIVKAEAEAAHAEFDAQKTEADARLAEAREKKLEISEKQGKLSAEAASVAGDIAETEAQAELEEEAGRCGRCAGIRCIPLCERGSRCGQWLLRESVPGCVGVQRVWVARVRPEVPSGNGHGCEHGRAHLCC